MTAVANLEDELVLHRDFERVTKDGAERPRTHREARLEEARELDEKLRPRRCSGFPVERRRRSSSLRASSIASHSSRRETSPGRRFAR